jgi:hypothetical protein
MNANTEAPFSISQIAKSVAAGSRKSKFLGYSAVCAIVAMLCVTAVSSSPPSVSGTYTWIEPPPTQDNFTASNSPQYTSYAESKGSIVHTGGSTPTTGLGAAYTRLEFSGEINSGLDTDDARWEVHFYRGEMELRAEVENHWEDEDTTYRVEAFGKLRYYGGINTTVGSTPTEHEAKKLLELTPEQTLKTWPEGGDPNSLVLGPEEGSGQSSRMFHFHQRDSIYFFYEVLANGNISTNRDESTFISESEVVDVVPGEDMISGDVILWDISDPANHVEVQRFPLK